MTPAMLFFFVRTAEVIQGLFWFHINFCTICSRCVKHAIDILIGIALNLYIAVGSMDISMMLIFLIHRFVSSSFSFFNDLQFSKYRSLTSLVKFIPRYLILLLL